MSAAINNWFKIPILVLAWFCLAVATPLAAQEEEPLRITDIRLSNYGGNNFVVSWRTSRPAADNELLLGLAPGALTIVKRDSLVSHAVSHFARVINSDIVFTDTTYYYKVRSDGLEAANSPVGYDSVYIREQILVTPGAFVQGSVIDARTGQPLRNELVRSFYRWSRDLSTGTQVDSTMWYTVVTNADGKFVMSMSNYRSYDGNIPLYVPGRTWLHLEIFGQGQDAITDSVLLPFVQNTLTESVVLDAYEVENVVTPGDVDGNGALNIFDLLDLLKVMGKKITPDPRMRAASDLDGNGRVDVFDLLELLKKLK